MKAQALTVGMKITHPHHGEGVVEKISANAAEIRFGNILRTIDPEIAEITVAEPSVKVGEAEVPLKQFIENTIKSVLDSLGFEKPDAVIDQLGARWHGGRVVLH